MNEPFLGVMLVTTFILLAIASLATESLIRHHHAQKVDFFDHYPVRPGDIVFLGDSITDGARWDELFPGLPVKNRGINADTTGGVFRRLEVILTGKPGAIFLLIGTNNLPWYAYHSNNKILADFTAILQCCRDRSPTTRIFIQSILPRHPSFAGRIRTLNARLAELAKSSGCTYIDLYSHFAGPDGGIRRDWSNDRLHLLAAGYACWVEILTPHIQELLPVLKKVSV